MRIIILLTVIIFLIGCTDPRIDEVEYQIHTAASALDEVVQIVEAEITDVALRDKLLVKLETIKRAHGRALEVLKRIRKDIIQSSSIPQDAKLALLQIISSAFK